MTSFNSSIITSGLNGKLAHHVTDLYLHAHEKQPTIYLRWYCKIPLAGRVISYIRFILVDSSDIRGQIKALNRNLKKEAEEYLKESLALYLLEVDSPSTQFKQLADNLKSYSTCISALNPASKFTPKALIERQLKPFIMNCFNNNLIDKANDILDAFNSKFSSELSFFQYLPSVHSSILKALELAELQIHEKKVRSRYLNIESPFSALQELYIKKYFPELEKRYFTTLNTWFCLFRPNDCASFLDQLRILNFELAFEIASIIVDKFKFSEPDKYDIVSLKTFDAMFAPFVKNVPEDIAQLGHYQHILNTLFGHSPNRNFVQNEFLACLQDNNESNLLKIKIILSNSYVTHDPKFISFLEEHIDLLLSPQNADFKAIVEEFLINFLLTTYDDKKCKCVLNVLQKLNVTSFSSIKYTSKVTLDRVVKFLKHLPSLTHLNLSNYAFLDKKTLKKISELKNLSSLKVQAFCPNSYLVKYLLRMKHLKTLEFTTTPSEQAIESLKLYNIENLIYPKG